MILARLVERYDALTANRGENGVVRPNRSQTLGQLVGTCGVPRVLRTTRLPIAANFENWIRLSENIEISFRDWLLKTPLSG